MAMVMVQKALHKLWKDVVLLDFNRCICASTLPEDYLPSTQRSDTKNVLPFTSHESLKLLPGGSRALAYARVKCSNISDVTSKYRAHIGFYSQPYEQTWQHVWNHLDGDSPQLSWAYIVQSTYPLCLHHLKLLLVPHKHAGNELLLGYYVECPPEPDLLATWLTRPVADDQPRSLQGVEIPLLQLMQAMSQHQQHCNDAPPTRVAGQHMWKWEQAASQYCHVSGIHNADAKMLELLPMGTHIEDICQGWPHLPTQDIPMRTMQYMTSTVCRTAHLRANMNPERDCSGNSSGDAGAGRTGGGTKHVEANRLYEYLAVHDGAVGDGCDCVYPCTAMNCARTGEVSLKLDELRSNGLQYKIVLQPDGDKGYGAYAGEGLPGHNTLLGEYAGELLTEQINERHDFYDTCGLHYIFDVTRAQRSRRDSSRVVAGERLSASIDATLLGNWTRFINHSCLPNLEAISICCPQPADTSEGPGARKHGGGRVTKKAYIIAFRVPYFIRPGTLLAFDYDGGHPSVQRHRAEQERLQNEAQLAGTPFTPSPYRWTQAELDASPLKLECKCGAGPMCRGYLFVKDTTGR